MPNVSPHSFSEKNPDKNEWEKYEGIDVATEHCAAQPPCLTPAKVWMKEQEVICFSSEASWISIYSLRWTLLQEPAP